MGAQRLLLHGCRRCALPLLLIHPQQRLLLALPLPGKVFMLLRKGALLAPLPCRPCGLRMQVRAMLRLLRLLRLLLPALPALQLAQLLLQICLQAVNQLLQLLAVCGLSAILAAAAAGGAARLITH